MKKFAARLESLHSEIACYGEALLRNGLGSAIGGLSREGAVADLLSLTPDASTGSLRMLHDDRVSRKDLLSQRRKALASRTASDRVLADVLPYAPKARWRLSAFHVAELYRVGFSPEHDTSIWRRSDPTLVPYFVPAAGIESAMIRMTKAFDRRLLADIDAIIVAALGFFEMMKIGPYGRSDSDVGRLLLQILLRQAGLPPTPLPLILHRRYWEHASILEAAIKRREPDSLVEAIVAAVEEAVAIGWPMITPLLQERFRLKAALAEIDTSPDNAEAIVDDLRSSMLLPQQRLLETLKIGRVEYEMRHLHSVGLIDRIAAGGRTWWSSPVTRRLARS